MGSVLSVSFILITLVLELLTELIPPGFYFPTLLQEMVGYDQQMSRLISAASSTIYVVFSFACLMLIDRLGRRK